MVSPSKRVAPALKTPTTSMSGREGRIMSVVMIGFSGDRTAFTVIARSDGAEFYRFRQRRARVLRRDEFLRDITLESGLGDRARDCRIVELLRGVYLVPSRHAGSVIVTDVLVIVADGANDIPFHDLHVVDVVQQLETIGADFLRQRDAPRRTIALVVRMIDPGVEKLHAYPHTMSRGGGHECRQTARTRVESLLIAQAVAISREADEVRNPGSRGEWQCSLIGRNQPCVVLDPVETAREPAARVGNCRVSHCAGKAVAPRDGPFIGLQQLD